MQNVVPRFTKDPGKVRSTAGALGADNRDIFGALGVSEAD